MRMTPQQMKKQLVDLIDLTVDFLEGRGDLEDKVVSTACLLDAMHFSGVQGMTLEEAQEEINRITRAWIREKASRQ